jgi:hypothetical protein
MRFKLFGAIVLSAVGRRDDQAAIQRNRADLDAEAGTFLVGEGGADIGPALAALAVALVLLDGEDAADL